LGFDLITIKKTIGCAKYIGNSYVK